MIDSLINPIQCEENNVCVDVRPKAYYPQSPLAQSISFDNGITLPLLYDVVLPYLLVRKPTPDEIHYCTRLSMTSRDA